MQYSDISIEKMMEALGEEYPIALAYANVNYYLYDFLLRTDDCHKAYLKIREVLDEVVINQLDNNETIKVLKEKLGTISVKQEIEIIDGHYGSSYFGIQPVKIVDYSNTNDWDSVEKMTSLEISIEEFDVADYLTPFLYKYFDNDLEANNRRREVFVDEDGNEEELLINRFEWYLTDNFYTYESFFRIISDIEETIDALKENKETEYTLKINIKSYAELYELLYEKDLSFEEIKMHFSNCPKNSMSADSVIDFYYRFIFRIKYMIKRGKENGCDLVSVKGP